MFQWVALIQLGGVDLKQHGETWVVGDRLTL